MSHEILYYDLWITWAVTNPLTSRIYGIIKVPIAQGEVFTHLLIFFFSSATCAATPSTKLPSTIDASRAVEAFKTRLEALTTLLQHNLTDISTSLFTKSIISQAEQQKAMSETPIPKARTVTLLNAVLSKIKFEPQVFVDFVKILETAPALIVQANELVLCYQGECILACNGLWGLLLVAKYRTLLYPPFHISVEKLIPPIQISDPIQNVNLIILFIKKIDVH